MYNHRAKSKRSRFAQNKILCMKNKQLKQKINLPAILP